MHIPCEADASRLSAFVRCTRLVGADAPEMSPDAPEMHPFWVHRVFDPILGIVAGETLNNRSLTWPSLYKREE